MKRRQPNLLLVTATLIGSCDRQMEEPSRNVGAAALGSPEAAALCPLPLQHFNLRGQHELTGSALSVPTGRIGIDRAGRTSWNHRAVSWQRLDEHMAFWAAAAVSSPPHLLWIRADDEASCAAVRKVLSAAIRAGRCTPSLCTFDWARVNPEAALPPPPEM